MYLVHGARVLAAGTLGLAMLAAGGVSANTVRVQVRGVLEKTGCRRQTDVVALLGGLTAVRGASEPSGKQNANFSGGIINIDDARKE